MGRIAIETGPAGRAVATNVRAVRRSRGWSQLQLAEEMTRIGRPLQASTVAKIEAEDRRVDVDDLIALAAALNVAPARLFIDKEATYDVSVELTPGHHAPQWSVWQWLTGYRPLQGQTEDIRDPRVQARTLDYLAERPTWLRTLEATGLAQSMASLQTAVLKALNTHRDQGPASELTQSRLNQVRQALNRISAEVDQLQEETSDGPR